MPLIDDWKKQDEEEQENEEFIDLTKLTNEDWVDMKRIGVQLYDQGACNKDQFKIAVFAFMRWIMTHDSEDEKLEHTGHRKH